MPFLVTAHGFDVAESLAARDPGQEVILFGRAVRRYQAANRAPDHFVGRVTEDLFRGLVPGRDDARQRLADDAVVGRFDDRGQARLGHVGGLDHGGIAGDETHALGIVQRARDDLGGKGRTITTPQAPLRANHVPIRHAQTIPGNRIFLSGRKQVLQGTAYQPGFGEPDQPAGVSIHLDDQARGIDLETAVGTSLVAMVRLVCHALGISWVAATPPAQAGTVRDAGYLDQRVASAHEDVETARLDDLHRVEAARYPARAGLERRASGTHASRVSARGLMHCAGGVDCGGLPDVCRYRPGLAKLVRFSAAGRRRSVYRATPSRSAA